MLDRSNRAGRRLLCQREPSMIHRGSVREVVDFTINCVVVWLLMPHLFLWLLLVAWTGTAYLLPPPNAVFGKVGSGLVFVGLLLSIGVIHAIVRHTTSVVVSNFWRKDPGTAAVE